MIFFNLSFIVLSTYLAATAETRLGLAINSAAVALNVLAVALHLIK